MQYLDTYLGMKAYKTIKDSSDLRLFRPELNMKRLKDSMTRLSMPGTDFDSQELINCIGKLVRVDEDFIPEGEGYSLYLRPTVIATHPFLGLSPPDDLLLYVSSGEFFLCCFFCSYHVYNNLLSLLLLPTGYYIACGTLLCLWL